MNFAFLFVFTISSIISFLALLFLADPFLAGKTMIFLFFTALFLSLMGFFAMVGALSAKLNDKEVDYGVSLRRGFFLASLSAAMVLLHKFFVLNLGNAAALVLLVVGVEMVFVYRKS